MDFPLPHLYNIGRKDSRDNEENRMVDAVCEVRLRNKRESGPHILTDWRAKGELAKGGHGSRVTSPVLLDLGAEC